MKNSYDVQIQDISKRINNMPTGFEIQSHDSIIILFMNAENRVSFFTVSLGVPVEQGVPQGYKRLIVIILPATRPFLGSCWLKKSSYINLQNDEEELTRNKFKVYTHPFQVP